MDYTDFTDFCREKGQKVQKRFYHEGHEVFFDRIYRMIPSTGSGQAGFGRWRAVK